MNLSTHSGSFEHFGSHGFEDAASYYVSMGWKIFPLQEGSKQPYPGSRGVLDATDDADRIRDWHTACSASNIAIATGASGLMVVDLDPRHHCWRTLERWEREGHVFPMTVHCRTRSGGLHLYFRFPQVLPEGWRRKLAGGVDIQVGNKYVVAPPSCIWREHTDDGIAGSYTWARGPIGGNLPSPPPWLLAMLKPPSTLKPGGRNDPSRWTSAAVVDRAIAGSLRKVARAGKGNRNNELNRQAHLFGKLIAENKISAEKAEELLMNVAMDVNPEIGGRATLATIRSGLKRGREHHVNRRG